jgi:hypothetical protein
MAREFESLFGETPFGLCRAEDGRLVEDADEQNVLAKIRACLRAGMSLKRAAEIIMEATDGNMDQDASRAP